MAMWVCVNTGANINHETGEINSTYEFADEGQMKKFKKAIKSKKKMADTSTPRTNRSYLTLQTVGKESLGAFRVGDSYSDEDITCWL